MTDTRIELANRLGVCSWSLQAGSTIELIGCVKTCGVSLVSLHLDPLRVDKANWADAPKQLQEAGIRVGSGMWACAGEDYSTLDSIRRTGGLRPDETWEVNMQSARENAELARRIGVDLITFHAGFLPHEENDPERGKLIDRLRHVADVFADHGVAIGFETGQETADTLVAVLNEIDRDSVGVNFDPANMLLYGMGDPIEALRSLSGHLQQVHIKDAQPSRQPGEWGSEVIAGTGAVDWSGFLTILQHGDFRGDLMIEREAGDSRVEDVQAAATLIRSFQQVA